MKQTTLMPRTATRDDIPGIAAAMARAFADYPLMAYMIPDAAKRAEKLRRREEAAGSGEPDESMPPVQPPGTPDT